MPDLGLGDRGAWWRYSRERGRVRRWTTHNEPWCAAVLGYEEGHHAPGLCEPATGLRAAHHLLLSHGWATAAIRAAAPDAEVRIVLIHSPAYPASESPGDVADEEDEAALAVGELVEVEGASVLFNGKASRHGSEWAADVCANNTHLPETFAAKVL